MLIQAVSVRRFRSLRRVELVECASTNILIGKNNSGKSNVLACLAEVIEHLRAGSVSAVWNSRGKPTDEIYNREVGTAIQIGIQLSLSEAENSELRDIIGRVTEGVDLALDQLATERHLSIIVNGSIVDGILFRYVHELAFGTLERDPSGLNRVWIPKRAGS